TDKTPDVCQTPLDCNTNNIVDVCDVVFGGKPDCNTNRLPDECESSGILSIVSNVLSPFHGEAPASPQTFVILDAFLAVRHVTIDLLYHGDFDSPGETFTLKLNNVLVATSTPTGGSGSCTSTGNEHLVIPRGTWNAALISGGPNMTIVATPATGVANCSA